MSPRLEGQTASPRVYTWGSGDFGELGVGVFEGCATPQRVKDLDAANVWQLSCGEAFVLALTTEGRIFSWGNGDRGQLGHGDRRTRATPKLITALFDEEIIQVACGRSHSACVRHDGLLYTWGNGFSGQLADGEAGNDALVPQRQERSGILPLAQVSCGWNHTVAITESGLVLTCGDNTMGELGRHVVDSDGSEQSFSPEADVVASLKNSRMIQVACSGHQTACLSDAGDVFFWGGFDDKGNAVAVPSVVNSFSGLRILQIACSFRHIVGITEDRQVVIHSHKSGENMLLTSETRDGKRVAEPVPGLSGHKIVQIACGDYHVAALSVTGNLHTWALNDVAAQEFSPLGRNVQEEDSALPCIVNALRNSVSTVNCGAFFTACVVGGEIASEPPALEGTKFERQQTTPPQEKVPSDEDGKRLDYWKCIDDAKRAIHGIKEDDMEQHLPKDALMKFVEDLRVEIENDELVTQDEKELLKFQIRKIKRVLMMDSDLDRAREFRAAHGNFSLLGSMTPMSEDSLSSAFAGVSVSQSPFSGAPFGVETNKPDGSIRSQDIASTVRSEHIPSSSASVITSSTKQQSELSSEIDALVAERTRLENLLHSQRNTIEINSGSAVPSTIASMRSQSEKSSMPPQSPASSLFGGAPPSTQAKRNHNYMADVREIRRLLSNPSPKAIKQAKTYIRAVKKDLHRDTSVSIETREEVLTILEGIEERYPELMLSSVPSTPVMGSILPTAPPSQPLPSPQPKAATPSTHYDDPLYVDALDSYLRELRELGMMLEDPSLDRAALAKLWTKSERLEERISKDNEIEDEKERVQLWDAVVEFQSCIRSYACELFRQELEDERELLEAIRSGAKPSRSTRIQDIRARVEQDPLLLEDHKKQLEEFLKPLEILWDYWSVLTDIFLYDPENASEGQNWRLSRKLFRTTRMMKFDTELVLDVRQELSAAIELAEKRLYHGVLQLPFVGVNPTKVAETNAQAALEILKTDIDELDTMDPLEAGSLRWKKAKLGNVTVRKLRINPFFIEPELRANYERLLDYVEEHLYSKDAIDEIEKRLNRKLDFDVPKNKKNDTPAKSKTANQFLDTLENLQVHGLTAAEKEQASGVLRNTISELGKATFSEEKKDELIDKADRMLREMYAERKAKPAPKTLGLAKRTDDSGSRPPSVLAGWLQNADIDTGKRDIISSNLEDIVQLLETDTSRPESSKGDEGWENLQIMTDAWKFRRLNLVRDLLRKVESGASLGTDDANQLVESLVALSTSEDPTGSTPKAVGSIHSQSSPKSSEAASMTYDHKLKHFQAIQRAQTQQDMVKIIQEIKEDPNLTSMEKEALEQEISETLQRVRARVSISPSPAL